MKLAEQSHKSVLIPRSRSQNVILQASLRAGIHGCVLTPTKQPGRILEFTCNGKCPSNPSSTSYRCLGLFVLSVSFGSKGEGTKEEKEIQRKSEFWYPSLFYSQGQPSKENVFLFIFLWRTHAGMGSVVRMIKCPRKVPGTMKGQLRYLGRTTPSGKKFAAQAPGCSLLGRLL